MTRALSWDGFLNVRDLGGLPLGAGGETAWGRVARSEAPSFLTERGWRELREHGVRTLVDLRCPTEGVYETRNGVRRLGQPIFHQDDPAFAALVRDIRDTGVFYRALVGFSHEAIARAVAAVADAPPGGVLVHCHHGRDRTGIVAALLLALAGVRPDSIAEDYVATRAALEARHEQDVAAAQTPEERDWLERIHRVRPEWILGALDAVGDPVVYLRAGGATDEQVERARRRLTA
jgi:protein-tyrosine phosphatase